MNWVKKTLFLWVYKLRLAVEISQYVWLWSDWCVFVLSERERLFWSACICPCYLSVAVAFGRPLQHISVCFDVLLGSPVSAPCCGPRSSVTTLPLQPSVWLRWHGVWKLTSSSSVVLFPYLAVLPPAFPTVCLSSSPRHGSISFQHRECVPPTCGRTTSFLINCVCGCFTRDELRLHQIFCIRVNFCQPPLPTYKQIKLRQRGIRKKIDI